MKSCRFLSGIVYFAFCFSAFAQSTNASLTGFVDDPSKAVIPKVSITAINTQTGVKTTTLTNGSGEYVLPALTPGTYRIEVDKQGFKGIIEAGLVLHVQDVLQVNFHMALGSMSETVTVTGEGQSAIPGVGLVVARQFVENTPLNGRSFQDLIALAPGTVSSTTGSGRFSVNGQRDDANYYTVDGVSANASADPRDVLSNGNYRTLTGTTPSLTVFGTTQSLATVDTLQEFRIQTSGFSAEFGRQPGGQIAITTRSGSTDPHASVFEYFRNDALNANSWLANNTGLKRPAERQNQFGGTFGGPLVIPKLLSKKSNTFFFASYEGDRLIIPQILASSEPTIQFRQAVVPGFQPIINALPIPNGTLNNDACLPSVSSCTAQWAATHSNPNQMDTGSIRIDKRIGGRVNLFGRVSQSNSSAINFSGASVATTTSTKLTTITAGATTGLTNNISNDLRFNYTYGGGTFDAAPVAFGGALPYDRTLLIPDQYGQGASFNAQILDLGIPNFPLLLPNYTRGRSDQRQYTILDSTSWILHSHAIKAGVDYRRLDPLLAASQYNLSVTCSGALIAFTQTGSCSSATLSTNRAANPPLRNFSVYAQDTWKASNHVTLEYGIRWELNPPPGATDGLYPLAVNQTNSLATMVLAPAGTPEYQTTYNNFAPRLGFVYQLNSSAERLVVLRGGFGLFYDTAQAQTIGSYRGAYPFVAKTSIGPLTFPILQGKLTPPSLDVPLTTPYAQLWLIDPGLTLPDTLQWNASLDQALTSKNTLTISYVGNKGTRLLSTYNNLGVSVINKNFSSVIITNNAGESNYNGLQVQDNGYLAPGLQMIMSYSWSHATDNGSLDSVNSFNGPLPGSSDNDIRHVLNTALNYKIPSSSIGRLANALSNGWLLSGRFTAQSGYPFTVIQGSFATPDGQTINFQPDLNPAVDPYLRGVPKVPGGYQLNKAAFIPVPVNASTHIPDHRGNLPRNYLRAPGFWNVNVSIQREFSVTERFHADLKIDSFNVLNHPNFGSIHNVLTDAQFGQASNAVQTIGVGNSLAGQLNTIYSTGAARSVQLSLTLRY